MNRNIVLASIAIAASLLLSARFATAFPSRRMSVFVPQSSVEKPGDVGLRVHTDIEVAVPPQAAFAGKAGEPQSLAMHENPDQVEPLLPPVPNLFFETPASLGCVYHLVSPLVAGCNPNVVTAVPSGGSRAIAVVDAYDDPTALSDLRAFSTQFGLTPIERGNFQVIFAGGSRPPVDGTGGWELEEALDTEWAHAFAPAAKLFLVEAKSSSLPDILMAEDVASAQVAAAGGGEVSNSWGSSEFLGETAFDTHFKKSTVVYFAESGDAPGVQYPAASPFVVATGGTSTTRTPSGSFFREVAWQDAGGGVSSFEPRPQFQNPISAIVGTRRGTHDVSFDSSPATGVWVFATPAGPATAGWYVVGGASVAAPTWAAIVNSAGHFFANTAAELTTVYNNRAVSADFRDIILGNCGPYGTQFAVVGYDLCTGVGSNQGKAGK